MIIANGPQMLYPRAVCILNYITMGGVKRSMGKVVSENAGFLPSTPRFRRLAAWLPGLVCPYRQARLFIRWLERLALAIVFSKGDRFASLRTLLTNFSERRLAELRRIILPRTPLNTSALAQRYVEGAPGS